MARTVTSVVPSSTPVIGGDTIEVNGTGFAAGDLVQVYGDYVVATFVSSTKLTVVTPAHAPGAYDVRVANSGFSDITPYGVFTLTAVALAIASVAPTSGPAAGGTVVHVYGTGFRAEPFHISLAGVALVATFVSGTEMTVVAPAHTAGAVDVYAQVDRGYGSNTLTGAYTYSAFVALAVTSTTPNHGSTAGGTAVTVNGAGFLAGAEVNLGNGVWLAATVVSSTVLTVVSAAGTAGLGTVSVRQPSISPVTLAAAYTYVAPVPAIPSPLGVDGNFYTDLANPASPVFYGPRTDGDWGSGLS